METETFSIDSLAIERCQDCENNQLKSSINILAVKRCRVAVELSVRRCRAICLTLMNTVAEPHWDPRGPWPPQNI